MELGVHCCSSDCKSYPSSLELIPSACAFLPQRMSNLQCPIGLLLELLAETMHMDIAILERVH